MLTSPRGRDRSGELPPPWETLTSSDPTCCGAGQVSKQPGLLSTHPVGSGVDSRDAAALEVSAYSPPPLLEGLTRTDAPAASSSLPPRAVSRARLLAQPASGLLTALPTLPPRTSVRRPSQTSPSASPASGSAHPSISPGTPASADSLLQQLQGRGEASGVGEDWKAVARKLLHHLHARPGCREACAQKGFYQVQPFQYFMEEQLM